MSQAAEAALAARPDGFCAQAVGRFLRRLRGQGDIDVVGTVDIDGAFVGGNVARLIVDSAIFHVPETIQRP